MCVRFANDPQYVAECESVVTENSDVSCPARHEKTKAEVRCSIILNFIFEVWATLFISSFNPSIHDCYQDKNRRVQDVDAEQITADEHKTDAVNSPISTGPDMVHWLFRKKVQANL